jgi:NitT/TauT family transport system substrate-binding protein
MKKCLFAAFLAATIAVLGGCQGAKPTDGATKVRLNETVHSVFYAPQYVALEKGYFSDEGLEITVDVANGSDKSMVALLAGEADIALLGSETAIYAYSEGKENYAVSFAQLTKRAGNFLVSREPIASFNWDLTRGKTIIGGREGGMPQMLLEYILVQNGIDPDKDVEIITNIQYDSTSGAFIAGIGDFTAEFEPSATALETGGYGHVVAALGEESGKVPYTVYMATKEYIKKNPEIIQKVTNAIGKGMTWVHEHNSKEIAEVIIPRFEGNTVEELEVMVNRYKSADVWNMDPVFTEESFTLIQDILEQSGKLAKRIPFGDLVDNTWAKITVGK